MTADANMASAKQPLEGSRVLILRAQFAGEEGVCLGPADNGKFSVSPFSSDSILALEFEREFALLIDLSTDPLKN